MPNNHPILVCSLFVVGENVQKQQQQKKHLPFKSSHNLFKEKKERLIKAY